ncbi:MAG: c-type cytochrome biogenesis protein CcmI [Pseudomonadota bacterium]|nr:MAG: c-type cytochrome biogenesis protein CcmI [Pseudomonadota bacterium]
MIFWFVVAAMLAVAGAFVLVPLLRSPRSTGPAQQDVDLAVHRQRLTELEADLKNDALTQAQFERARAELERQMADDLAASGATATATTALTARWTAIAVGVAVPVLALGLYFSLGDLDAPTRTTTGTPQQAQTPDAHSFDEMINRLAARLAANPKDGEGWVMLGRSYVVVKRFGEAGLAFAKASEILGDQPDLLADHAEALALAANNNMQGQPAALVSQALKANPNHPKSLWLMGHALIQQGRPAEGVGYWRRLLAQLPPGSEGRPMVEQLITQVQNANPQLAQAAPPAPASAKPKAKVAVRVQLAPSLATKAAPTDTVFVFARAAQGPKMPLAIVRKQVKDLPATITLDDSMAMTPTMTMSSAAQVVFGARVSKTGNATPQSGDMEGLSAPLPPTIKETVVITISDVVR